MFKWLGTYKITYRRYYCILPSSLKLDKVHSSKVFCDIFHENVWFIFIETNILILFFCILYTCAVFQQERVCYVIRLLLINIYLVDFCLLKNFIHFEFIWFVNVENLITKLQLLNVFVLLLLAFRFLARLTNLIEFFFFVDTLKRQYRDFSFLDDFIKSLPWMRIIASFIFLLLLLKA